MSFPEFAASVAREARPPAALGGALRALWLDAKGDWEAAHTAAQSDDSAEGAWVHAYLHRKEGDAANARYWYVQAGRRPPRSDLALATEWEQIARELLGESRAQ